MSESCLGWFVFAIRPEQRDIRYVDIVENNPYFNGDGSRVKNSLTNLLATDFSAYHLTPVPVYQSDQRKDIKYRMWQLCGKVGLYLHEDEFERIWEKFGEYLPPEDGGGTDRR